MIRMTSALDTFVPNRPAFILDFTIHDAWLNTAALKAGNVTKDTPDTVPGVTYWERNKDGNPTGVVVEIQWMGTYIDAGAWDAEKMIPESAEKLFAIAVKMGRYPYFARAGNKVSISADVPSTLPNMQAPLFVVQAAVSLRNPLAPQSKVFPPKNKGMSVAQALRAVSIDAAWQLRMEDKIGSLEVGKYADLVVLEKTPFDVDPMEIAEIGVLMTMMDGKFTYKVNGDASENGKTPGIPICLRRN